MADDGGDLWLEVKSTTGLHGRFDWPRAEFELGLRARERYVLCRVYEVDSTTPTVRREFDPVAKLLAGAMRLDISTLAAEIAPLTASLGGRLLGGVANADPGSNRGEARWPHGRRPG